MSLPEWLVERVALDEVPPASRDRVAQAEERELAERVAAVREDSAAELARYPAGPAAAQIAARVAAEKRQRQRRRLQWMAGLGVAASAATALLVVRTAERAAVERMVDERTVDARMIDARVVDERAVDPRGAADGTDEDTRVKGTPRLMVFRQVGEQAERLAQDAFVRAGDVIQVRYSAGGQAYGVIASVDGAGVVTLHFPSSADASREATAISPEKTALPNAYALDDAPRFERFFFVTSSSPLDVKEVLGAARALARRDDSATASLELPSGLRQWSLRLRKVDRTTNHESP